MKAEYFCPTRKPKVIHQMNWFLSDIVFYFDLSSKIVEKHGQESCVAIFRIKHKSFIKRFINWIKTN